MRTKLLFFIGIFSSLISIAQLPEKVLVGYWHAWHQTTMPMIPLTEVDDRYNVICLSFAGATDGNINTLNFNYSPWGTMAYYNLNLLKNDIQTVKQQGKVILLSVGGANNSFRLTSVTEKNTFVSRMKTIIADLGVDGIDIDLEQTDYLCPGNLDTKVNINSPWLHMQLLIDGTKELLDWYQDTYSKKMILTTAPEVFYTSGGLSPWNPCSGAFLPYLEALKDEMDLVMVQLYNSGPNYSIQYNLYNSSTEYTVGTVEFVVSQTEAMIEGFTFRSNHPRLSGTFTGFPASKIAVALPANNCSAGSGYLNPANVQTAVRLLRGEQNTGSTYPLAKTYPNLRGLMTWSINQDLRSNCGGHTSKAFAENYAVLFPSDDVSVQEITFTDEQLRIFPNPVKEQLTIEVDDARTLPLQIINLQGKLVFQAVFTQTTSLDVSDLAPGMYLVKIGNTTKKIIKK